MKKTALYSALAAIGIAGMSGSASAALSTLSVLNIDAGVGVCAPAGTGTFPDCTFSSNVPTGSYFGMDTSGDGKIQNGEKNPISAGTDGGVSLGGAQSAGAIDSTWSFGGNTGNHFTLGALSIIDDGAGDGVAALSGSNWRVDWNGGPIDMGGGGNMSIVCGNQCEAGDTYVLDYTATVPSGGFSGFFYSLHLVGTISEVPVPAAVWLFGSGLLGLVGVARRKKA